MVTDSELKTYYNQRYAKDGRSTMRPPEAYGVFLDFLNVKPGETLLDVACGTGFLLHSAHRRGLKTFGIDISEEAVAVARDVSPESTVEVATGENIPFKDNLFDNLTCLGSLEHFNDAAAGLKEFQRVTTPGAKMCIMVPNSQYWAWKLKGESGTEQKTVQEQLMTCKEWRALLEANGLKILQIHRDDWPVKDRPIFGGKGPTAMIKRIVFRIVWRIMPLNYSYQFVIVATK